MQPLSEVVLAILPGARDDEQVEVALCQFAEGNKIELRQQTWGEGIGWFTQSRVRLEPHQVGELRGVVGVGAGHQPRAVRRGTNERLPKEFSSVSPRSFSPRVVRADSA